MDDYARCPHCGSLNYKEKSEYVLQCQECGCYYHRGEYEENKEEEKRG